MRDKKLKVRGIKAGSYLRLICKPGCEQKNGGGEVICGPDEEFSFDLQYPTISEARKLIGWAIHNGLKPQRIVARWPHRNRACLAPYLPLKESTYLRVCDYRPLYALLANTNGAKVD